MAKKTETEENKEQVAEKPVITEKTPLNLATMAYLLDEMEEGQVISSDYFTFEPGDEQRIIAVELTEISPFNGKGTDLVPAVKFMMKDGLYKVCADKVLVSTCRNLFLKGQKNIALHVACTGWIEGENGEYRSFEIKELVRKK